jgi:hypothetical protein
MPRNRRDSWVGDSRPETQKIGTPEHFRWLHGIVQALLVLNVLDAIWTIAEIASGRASEANPLMAGLAHSEPVLFAFVKILLVSLGSYILWQHRQKATAVCAIFVAFMVYYCLLLYHLFAMDLRLFWRLFD